MTNKIIPKRRNGFYYIDSRRIYVSVTKVLQIIAKPQIAIWAAIEAARAALADPTLSENEAANVIYQKKKAGGNRGSAIHSFAELYQKGAKIPLDNMPEEFRGYAQAFIDFINIFNPKITHRELQIFSDKYQYAGTLDMILENDKGENYLVDIKTSKSIYPETGLQLAAYKQAVEEMEITKIDKMAVILLQEDGCFQFADINAPLEAFLAAKTLWLWSNDEKYKARIPKKNKNGGDKNEMVRR